MKLIKVIVVILVFAAAVRAQQNNTVLCEDESYFPNLDCNELINMVPCNEIMSVQLPSGLPYCAASCNFCESGSNVMIAPQSLTSGIAPEIETQVETDMDENEQDDQSEDVVDDMVNSYSLMGLTPAPIVEQQFAPTEELSSPSLETEIISAVMELPELIPPTLTPVLSPSPTPLPAILISSPVQAAVPQPQVPTAQTSPGFAAPGGDDQDTGTSTTTPSASPTPLSITPTPSTPVLASVPPPSYLYSPPEPSSFSQPPSYFLPPPPPQGNVQNATCPTTNSCQCKKSWEYSNNTISGCFEAQGFCEVNITTCSPEGQQKLIPLTLGDQTYGYADTCNSNCQIPTLDTTTVFAQPPPAPTPTLPAPPSPAPTPNQQNQQGPSSNLYGLLAPYYYGSMPTPSANPYYTGYNFGQTTLTPTPAPTYDFNFGNVPGYAPTSYFTLPRLTMDELYCVC